MVLNSVDVCGRCFKDFSPGLIFIVVTQVCIYFCTS